MRLAVCLLSILGASCSTTALAGCEAAYTLDQVVGDMTAVETGLITSDVSVVINGAARLEAGLPCLDQVIMVSVVGRTYRAIAAGAIAGGREDQARQWFAVALEVDPTFAYGLEDLPVEHDVRRIYGEVQGRHTSVQARVADRDLAHAGHYLDGRRIHAPVATNARPHLYQVRTETVRSWVIDGAAFPADTLVEAGEVEEPAAVASSDFKEVERLRPPEKTPLIVAGATSILGAVGAFAAAVVEREGFEQCETAECVNRTTTNTNTLMVVSTGLLAIGGAGFVVSATIDAGGGPGLAGHIRW